MLRKGKGLTTETEENKRYDQQGWGSGGLTEEPVIWGTTVRVLFGRGGKVTPPLARKLELRPVGDLRSRTARSEMIGLKMQKAAAVWTWFSGWKEVYRRRMNIGSLSSLFLMCHFLLRSLTFLWLTTSGQSQKNVWKDNKRGDGRDEGDLWENWWVKATLSLLLFY